MKKFLSLVMALAMTLTLVTVGASAKDFTDKSTINYKEAVDVISTLGVVDGYTNGTFNPTATLTRGAAAKIICNLILGPTTASALGVTSAPFKDVPVSNVFAGYIAYCSQAGIINGYSDGTFKPAATVTGYQFMKMLLGALGYDGTIEGFTGTNWTVNVAKLAVSIGLDDGNSSFLGSKAMTREEACLYAFNTLTADVVKYQSKGTNITVGGIEIATGATAAEKITYTTESDNYAGSNTTDPGYGSQQFCEKYFPKLELTNAAATDSFGRVANAWEYDGTTIGTYSNTSAKYTFTVTKAEAADAATGVNVIAGIKDATNNDNLTFTTTQYVLNGDTTVTAATAALNLGDTVEVYATKNAVSRVVVIRYALAKLAVAKVAANTKDSDGNVATYQLTSAAGASFNSMYDTQFPGYASTYVKDTVVAVAVNPATSKVIGSYIPTYVTGAISAISDGKNVTLAGTKYTFVTATPYNPDSVTGSTVDWTNGSYGVYVGTTGYALGLAKVSGTASLTDVYYVNDVYTDTSTAYGVQTTKAYVQAVSLAGTTKVFEVGFDAGTAITSGTTYPAGAYTKSNDVYTTATGTAPADGTYYKINGTVGTLMTYSYNSDSKLYEGTAYNTNSTYYVALNQAQTLTSSSTKTSTAPFSSKAAYLTSDTQYVVLAKDGADLTVKVLTSGVKITNENTAVVATKDSNGNYIAAYVVVDLAGSYDGVQDYSDMLYTKSVSTTKNGSSTYAVDVYNMSGAKSTVTATAGGYANKFVNYSLNSDGNYVLSQVASSTLTLADTTNNIWKDEKGVVYGATFTGLFNNLLSFKVTGSPDTIYNDVDASNAIVVDLRDTTVTGQYTGIVSSVSDIANAADTLNGSGHDYTVTFDTYVSASGVSVIFVTNIA